MPSPAAEPLTEGSLVRVPVVVRESSTKRLLPGIQVEVVDLDHEQDRSVTGRDGQTSVVLRYGKTATLRLTNTGYVSERRVRPTAGQSSDPIVLEAILQPISGWDAAPYMASCMGRVDLENSIAVAGVVRDSVTMRPLNGAIVALPVHNCGLLTDSDGRYHLRMPPVDRTTLEFQYIGYQFVVDTIAGMSVGDRIEHNVLLKTLAIELSHVQTGARVSRRSP